MLHGSNARRNHTLFFLVCLQPIAGRRHVSWRRYVVNTYVLGQEIDVIVQLSMKADADQPIFAVGLCQFTGIQDGVKGVD